MRYFRQIKFEFIAFALAAALFFRSVVDGSGFGFSVTLFVFLVLLLQLLLLKKINKNALLVILPIFLFSFGGYCIAVYYHEEPFFALRGLVRYSSYAMVFFIAYHSRIQLSSIYNIYTIILLIQVVVTFYQRIVLGVHRPPGTLINNNHINYLLIPYFSISFLYYKKYIRSFLVFLYSLFLGGIGGSILLLFIGSINLFVITKGTTRIVAISLIPVFFFLFSLMLSERIEEQRAGMAQLEERIESDRPGGDGGSLIWRIVTWKLMVEELIEKNSLVFGQGIDYASLASPYFLSASIREPHNDYVRNLLEFGIIGLTLYVLLYFKYTKFYFKLRKNCPFANSIFFTLIALAIGQLSGNIISQTTLWWFVFAFAGTYLRLYHKNEQYYERN